MSVVGSQENLTNSQLQKIIWGQDVYHNSNNNKSVSCLCSFVSAKSHAVILKHVVNAHDKTFECHICDETFKSNKAYDLLFIMEDEK